MTNYAKEIFILGLSSSPRPGGNSDILLDRALAGARSVGPGLKTEKIALGRLRFSPCRECPDMPGDGRCILNDDLQAVYAKIEQADAIILASPIFFGSLSAQAKAMIDRMQCLWRAQYVLHQPVWKGAKPKAGGFICVQASAKEDFFQNARSIVKNLFATINTQYREELFCPGLEEKGAVLDHKDFLDSAERLGRNICRGITT